MKVKSPNKTTPRNVVRDFTSDFGSFNIFPPRKYCIIKKKKKKIDVRSLVTEVDIINSPVSCPNLPNTCLLSVESVFLSRNASVSIKKSVTLLLSFF